MSEGNKNRLNKKVVIPVTAAAIIFAGAGIGSYKYVQSNLDDKTKQEAVDSIGKDNTNNDSDVENDSSNDNNNENNVENDESDSEENDVEIKFSEDGKITFSKKETEDNTNQYSHLKDIVEQKAKDDSIVIVLGEDKPKFEKGDGGLGDGLLASTDKNPLPNTDKTENDNEVKPEEPNIPEIPVNHEKPTDPDKPIIPIEPEKPTDPEKPIIPIEPEEPTDPEKPVEPEMPVVDKVNLGELIAEASTYSQSRYTDSSWEKLSDIVVVGSKLLDDKNAIQSQVDIAVERIKNALDGLVVKAPTLVVNGLDALENNVSKEEVININVSGSDVDGNRVRATVILNDETIRGKRGDYELQLQKGENKLKVIVEDRYGGKTEDSFELIYEVEDLLEESPAISVEGLHSDNVKDGKLTFTVASLDYEGKDIKTLVLFNGGEITSNDSVLYEVDLVEGENTFEFKATDDNGAYTTKVVVIEYELEDKFAILNVTNVDEKHIQDGILTINAEATTKDNQKITPIVTNNGNVIEANGVQYDIHLAEGENKIVVEAVTESGVVVKEYYTINYVVEVPEVEESEDNTESDNDTEIEVEDNDAKTETDENESNQTEKEIEKEQDNKVNDEVTEE